MKRFLLTVLAFGMFLIASDCAFSDTITTKHGTLQGKIKFAVKDFIEIKTNEGERKLWRNPNLHAARDVITVGFFKKKRISGELFIVDDQSVEIKTSTGVLKINRWKVRDISVSDYTLDLPIADIKK